MGSEMCIRDSLRAQFERFCQSRNYEITTWELYIAYFHLFMQRLRRAGQEGYDFDQDQDVWRDDDDDQPPPAGHGDGGGGDGA